MRYQWVDNQGNALTCKEKITVLEENMRELEQTCRDALDDALLMGCTQESAKTALHAMIERLTPSVKERG